MKIIVERNDTRWTVTDDVTGVVGKGRIRDAAIACYNRGVELWQAKQALLGVDSQHLVGNMQNFIRRKYDETNINNRITSFFICNNTE